MEYKGGEVGKLAYLGFGAHGGEGVGVWVGGGKLAGGDEGAEVGGARGEVEDGRDGEVGDDFELEFCGEEREELREFGGGGGRGTGELALGGRYGSHLDGWFFGGEFGVDGTLVWRR